MVVEVIGDGQHVDADVLGLSSEWDQVLGPIQTGSLQREAERTVALWHGDGGAGLGHEWGG